MARKKKPTAILTWRDLLLQHGIVPSHGSPEERLLQALQQSWKPGWWPLPWTLADTERRLVLCMLTAPEWEDGRIAKHTDVPLPEVWKVRVAIAAGHPHVERIRSELDAAVTKRLGRPTQLSLIQGETGLKP